MANVKPKNANFTKSEIDVLIDEVECRKEVLFGKLSRSLTSDMKRVAWSEVTAKVNAVSGDVARTDKSVKKKWIDMSSLTKRKEAARRSDMKVTGGGESVISVLSDTEMKVVGLLCTESIDGVSGGVDVGIMGSVVSEDDPVTVGCSYDSVVPSVSEVVSVLPPVSEVVPKMATASKKWRETDSVEELTRLEKRRLEVEEERLAVEKKRLAVEEERLKLEQEKWLWMKSIGRQGVTFADE